MVAGNGSRAHPISALWLRACCRSAEIVTGTVRKVGPTSPVGGEELSAEVCPGVAAQSVGTRHLAIIRLTRSKNRLA